MFTSQQHEGSTTEVNPILNYVREAIKRWNSPALSLPAVAEEQMYSIREAEVYGAQATYGFDATKEQIRHARSVFSLILRLEEKN